MKDFDEWNKVKKEVDKRTNTINVKNREIYWVSIGENIGSEQNGKGSAFSRPILIVRKLNRNLFFGVPLSTTKPRTIKTKRLASSNAYEWTSKSKMKK